MCLQHAVDPETDFNSLNEKHITPEEKMLESIQNDLGSHSDTIVDHGDTGQIEQEYISDITSFGVKKFSTRSSMQNGITILIKLRI